MSRECEYNQSESNMFSRVDSYAHLFVENGTIASLLADTLVTRNRRRFGVLGFPTLCGHGYYPSTE